MLNSQHKQICLYTDVETWERLQAIAKDMHLSCSAAFTRMVWDKQLKSETRPQSEVNENDRN